MSQWLSEVIAEGQRQNDWLSGNRQQATAALANVKWPVRRQEAWRFTPLVPVEKRTVSLAGPSEQQSTAPVIFKRNTREREEVPLWCTPWCCPAVVHLVVLPRGAARGAARGAK